MKRATKFYLLANLRAIKCMFRGHRYTDKVYVTEFDTLMRKCQTCRIKRNILFLEDDPLITSFKLGLGYAWSFMGEMYSILRDCHPEYNKVGLFLLSIPLEIIGAWQRFWIHFDRIPSITYEWTYAIQDWVFTKLDSR